MTPPSKKRQGDPLSSTPDDIGIDRRNGGAPGFTLQVDGVQLNMIHQFCVQAQFPTVELKQAAASLQQAVEDLVPQEA